MSQNESATATPRQHHHLHGTLAYQQHGSGPPMLLLHGWGGAAAYWTHTVDHFARHRTCYVPDMPGYGQSPPMPQMASAAHLAERLGAFAEAHNLAPFDLVGHSFGGAVAVHLAARWPQRVRRLVLTCFGAFTTEAEQTILAPLSSQTDMLLAFWRPWLHVARPWFTFWQGWSAAVGCEGPLPALLSQPFFHRLPDNPAMLCDGYRILMQMDYRTALESASSMFSPALPDALRAIKSPTLLVGARHDRVILPANIEHAARMIPNHRLAWLDACGHVPMIECPAEYHRVLTSFLLA